jgi:type VI secretion system protein VasG
MVTADIKSLLLHLNDFCTNTLHSAAGLCVTRTNYEIGVEHFLIKLFDDQRSDCPLIFSAFGVDTGRLTRALELAIEDYKTGNSGKPVFSPTLLDLVENAWVTASVDFGDAKIRSGAILLAFLGRPNYFGSTRYLEFLNPIGREALSSKFWDITKSSVENVAALKGAARAAGGEAAPGGFLAKYCVDFTERAKNGEIDPVFGRDLEIRQMIDILGRRRKNNPICVGEPGVGKTAVVEGMALRIVEGDVPEMLKNVSLVGLDMGLLEAGAGVKGEFENRLKGVITEIKSSEKPIILFIDEAHTLIGAGASAGGGDAANLLKPALARGELRTIAATTWSEYKKYFEKDAALARRFQLVKLDEPGVESTILMLRGLKGGYEDAHKVIVRDDAVVAAAELSNRYITGRFLPDKAIDLLDTSCSRVKINLTAKPVALEDMERQMQACKRVKTAVDRDRDNGLAVDEKAYGDVVEKEKVLIEESEKLRSRWLSEQEAAHKVVEARAALNAAGPDDGKREELRRQLEEVVTELKAIQGESPMIQIEVDPDGVAQVVSDWTGIPLGKVLKDEAQTIIHLETRLKERIKGQDGAASVLGEVIRAAKAGIKNPDQPIGVFLFVGPSGVGKTETGLAIADLLFGSERHIVTINMSEFQEGHTVSRLIGSPPGYVGYGEGGMLTEAVRQKPYSVVLLDEAEKAHIDVMNLFYQVFDKGMLSDGEGKEINFKNTIIILTSNLASDVITEMSQGSERPPMEVLTGAIRPILSAHFKPALLARMNIVPFYALDGDAMKMIAELKLKRVAATLMTNNQMSFTYAPGVVDQIAARCTEVETGARNIEYILNINILPRLSQLILTHLSEGGMPSQVYLDTDKAGSFTFRFDGQGV